MMNQSVLVSVIIPCYNSERWISEALDSVIAQTHHPLEIIIVNDGSTDNSQIIIQKFADLYPKLIRHFTISNSGASAARNYGLRLAIGDYCLFMDADDLMLPETISGQLSVFSGRKDFIVACTWWSIEWNGKDWERHVPKPYRLEDPIASELRYGDYIPGPALLWPRDIIMGIGGWGDGRNPNDDGELRLRARINGFEIVHSDLGGFVYRRYSSSSFSGIKSKQHLLALIQGWEKIESLLVQRGLIDTYRLDLACAYHSLASSIMPLDEELGDHALSHAVRLGGMRSVHGTLPHRILCYTIGLKRKEHLARYLINSPLSILLGRTHVKSSLVEFSNPKSL